MKDDERHCWNCFWWEDCEIFEHSLKTTESYCDKHDIETDAKHVCDDHRFPMENYEPEIKIPNGVWGRTDSTIGCKDWKGDKGYESILGYESVGCMCCEHLIAQQTPPLAGKRIELSCWKEHSLIVAVIRDPKGG